jgi:tRNA (guanine26-N2/guanine27-N2)-dimethyltransferase
VLEALSATGLRAIRYAKEIDGLGTIVANDIEQKAVENIRRNMRHNDVLETKVVPNCGDAVMYLYQHRTGAKFDIIDLVGTGQLSIMKREC